MRPVSADIERPNSGLDRLLFPSTSFGGLRFVVFSALNASIRNCTSAPGPVTHGILNDLISETSRFKNRGPRNEFRGRLPCVPGAGVGKSDALKMPFRKSSLLSPESEGPNDGMFGRSLPSPS